MLISSTLNQYLHLQRKSVTLLLSLLFSLAFADTLSFLASVKKCSLHTHHLLVLSYLCSLFLSLCKLFPAAFSFARVFYKNIAFCEKKIATAVGQYQMSVIKDQNYKVCLIGTNRPFSYSEKNQNRMIFCCIL